MSVTVNEFGHVLHEWQEENSAPWGKLRYHSTWRNIAKHIEDRPLRILDIGGGDGMDAIYYASLGHSVTLIEYIKQIEPSRKGSLDGCRSKD